MRIAILKETKAGERRSAIAPDAVKRYVKLGATVHIEKGAGEQSGISDEALKEAGAAICASAKTALDKADILLCVNAPDTQTLDLLSANTLIIGMLSPLSADGAIDEINQRKLTAFALELLPRTSRAQSMDVLSSQANLAGYRAVIEAVAAQSKVLPMMMTAAGTVSPAKVLVLGAGVAGLQAIATTKRLGAVVTASDVRPEVKEQIESLGGKFLEVKDAAESGSGEGGYAKEMSKEYQEKQKALIHETLKNTDICITTALIPGKPAPELITPAMLKDMKAGSVIVDMAASNGGNCKASVADKIVQKDGVTLIGYTDLPSRAAADATPLYARNLYNFIADLMVNKESGGLSVAWDDDLIKGTLICKDGEIVHERVQGIVKEAKPAPAKKPAASGAKKASAKANSKASKAQEEPKDE